LRRHTHNDDNFEITELKVVTYLDRDKQNIIKYFRPIKLILTDEENIRL